MSGIPRRCSAQASLLPARPTCPTAPGRWHSGDSSEPLRVFQSCKCQKGFSSIVIAPTTNVEGQKYGNEMLRPGAYCFKAYHLKLTSMISKFELIQINIYLIFNIIIMSCISVILDIFTEFHR